MTESLLVSPDAPLTCPKCRRSISLREGCVQQALEGILRSGGAALGVLVTMPGAAERKLN